MILNEDTFALFAAKNYTNASCESYEEFQEDLNRIRYLKKLLYTYKNKKVLRERLILNHLVVLYNTFQPRACTQMLFYKLHEYLGELAPFLALLGYLPERVEVGKDTIYTKDIQWNINVSSALTLLIRKDE